MHNCKKILFLRHGDTCFSGKYIGSFDVPLSAKGLQQIKKIRSFILLQKIEKVFCSPMLRCLQTFEQLALSLSAPVNLEENLREINFGRWEGKSFKEIVETDPDLVDQWSKGYANFTFPEGENIAHFIQRVEQIKSQILSINHHRILVISHGGVIRSMICSLLGQSQEKYLQYAVEKGTVSMIEVYENGAVLKGFNLKPMG